MVSTPYCRVEAAPHGKRQPTYSEFSRSGTRNLPGITLFVFAHLISLSALDGGITLTAPTSIVAPNIEVGPDAVVLSSGDQTMSIHNTGKLGWQLSGEITQNMVEGWNSGIQLPATFKFISITHISGGGNNGTAGISISPDQLMIIAEPDFGKGKYDIVFEIIYDVPAFPYADTYHGVLTFIAQE